MKGLILPRFLLGAVALAAAGIIVFGATGCDELSARSGVKEANKLYSEGKYEEAIEIYNDSIAKSPHLSIAHHNAGLTHLKMFEMGDPGADTEAHAKAAIGHFQAYLKSAPKDEKIISAMVKLYVDSGDYDGAIGYWEAKLKDAPRNMKALTELATIAEKALRFDAALEWHRKRAEVAESAEEKVNALSSIGMLQFRRLLEDKETFGVKRLTMADIGIEAFQTAISLQPENEQLYALLDVLYQQRGWATDVSYARAVEGTSALVNRLKWRDLFQEKQQKAKEDAEKASSEASNGAER